MAMDFPALPVDGQVYTPPGAPDYIYHSASTAWEIQTSGNNSAFVAKAGDVMSGLLTLSGAPVNSNHAATKAYADSGDSARVLKSGDTMTGNLTADYITSNTTLLANGGRILANSGSVESSVGCISTQYGSTWGFWNSALGMAFGYMDSSGVPAGQAAVLTTARFTITAGSPDKPGGGPWTAISDARIKSVVGDYTSGLDAVNALHPVRYMYKGNDTESPPGNQNFGILPTNENKTSQPPVPYPNSFHYGLAVEQKEFIGLIAQDAEVPMPEMVTRKSGYVDGVQVDDLRVLDTGPLIFALVNAVKELAARVEQLEARS